MRASKRVLLVDDDPDSRKRISSILAPPGFQCREVDNARAAAKRERPDVIVLDSYSRTSGLVVLVDPGTDARGTPVILVSAQASEIDRARVRGGGRRLYLGRTTRRSSWRAAAVLRGFELGDVGVQPRGKGSVRSTSRRAGRAGGERSDRR
jgi:DNA-binding response OmpR family regulator